ncbi:MAG: hypothetical protein COB67_08820 [SAR324 cluster bacterium]|uniref:DNA 3'-5' helicase n=1 Tax=SAR324 cluster bacterium TaxID=2024889 RepID=A0A2A4T1A1_9DELT|nr:MAG: hypothetical protein COB67_08820 [SAR324 cluster bacterium]
MAHQTSSGIDFKKELNTPQYEAVTNLEGPQLVIAGAGSGKTRVLVHRVANLIEQGVVPQSILLLTFTRKSSNEMMQRASKILDRRCMQIAGGTFHSFCNKILRRYATAIGYSTRFTIADRADAEDIITIYRSALDGPKRKSFPKKGTIMNILSKAVNTGKTVQALLQEEYPQYEEEAEVIVRIGKSYKKYKKEHSIMDYDDLLTNAVTLLKENAEIRRHLSNSYRYIMVDEYQDTNKIQAHIACLLASEHQNIMVVGDDSQSIYSFRGANFKNIMDFPKLFEKCTITRLEQNYRSTQPILDFTNAIIENAREKYTKHLFSEIKGDIRPKLIQPIGQDEEAEFICKKILELKQEGTPLNRIAVLFRSSYHANRLEVALSRHHLPYEKYGGLKFMDSAHIKDLLAYIRIALNPLDNISWKRVLRLLEGIGEVTAGKIIEDIVTEGVSALTSKKYAKRKYAKLLLELQEIMILIMDEATDPLDHLEALMKYYEPILKKSYEDYHKRASDLESLLQIAERYQVGDEFLSDLTLDPPNTKSDVNPDEKVEDPLILSTIHSAKGLEWDSVFLIHFLEGYLPSRQSLDSDSGIEEERRLFYVAATRAERNLWLSSPSFYINDYAGFSETSRFLKEMSYLDDLVDKTELPNSQDEYDSFSNADRVNDFFGDEY